jgi:hypothetical protein
MNAPALPLLLKLGLLHPIATVLYVLPNIRISRGRGSAAGDSQVVETSDILPTPENGNVSEDESDVLDVLAEAETLYLDRMVVSAAIRASDSQLFGGRDRDKDGFVRLMLRNSYHHFVLPGSTEERYVVFEPRLLIHESGVLQLDLVLSVSDTAIAVREALAMSWGPELLFVRSQMSQPLLTGTQWQNRADYSAGEVDANKPLATIEHDPPVSMSELLWVHMEAVLSVLRRTNEDWIIYPVTILDVDDCCSPADWKRAHRDDLVRLTIRGSIDRRVADHAPTPRDLSSDADYSLHANLGSATYFQWNGEAPVGVPELSTVLLFEYALLQYMRLHRLEGEVAKFRLGERDLRARYKNAVRLFSELRQKDLRSGETREIVRHVMDDYGAPEIRRTIETGLNLSGSAYATASAEQASRRAWWVTIAATVVTFIVAVQPLQELLQSLPEASQDEAVPLQVLRWFSQRGFWAPWLVLGSVLLAIIVLWLLSLANRVRFARFRSRRRGYKWPAEFKVDSSFSPANAGPRMTSFEVGLAGKLDQLHAPDVPDQQ